VIRRVAASAVLAALLLTVTAAHAQLIGPLPPGTNLRVPGDQSREPSVRSPLTLTPSVTIAEEYNDNVLLDNKNKQWDFITAIVPGLTLTAESTTYRLLAAYNFRAELYARDSSRNEAFNRHNLLVEGLYRVNPSLTLTLSEGFFFSTDTNTVSQEGVATGRGTSYSNSLTPGFSYQFDRQNTQRTLFNYTVLRYGNNNQTTSDQTFSQALDSDVFRFEPAFDHIFSPRLTGTVGYKFGYFDVHRLGTATVHTPLVGVAYRITETLTGTLNGGPSIVHEDRLDETRLTPAVTASLTQRLPFGSASFVYDRAVGTAGGFGGVTDNQSIGAVLRVTTFIKNLSIELLPRYHTSESSDNAIDVRGWTVPLRVAYQFNRYVTAVAGYQFFRQRASGTLVNFVGGGLANDVDQNRVSVGLQFGYPIDIQ
jgi:hypothetical protein